MDEPVDFPQISRKQEVSVQAPNGHAYQARAPSQPANHLRQRACDNLQIFLTAVMIIQETGFLYIIRTDSAMESDDPKSFHLRLFMFVAVNQSLVVPLLFFLHGRLDQQASTSSAPSGRAKPKYLSVSKGCQRLLLAICCKLFLQQLPPSVSPAIETGVFHWSAISPVVAFPGLLLIFDFAVSKCLESLENERIASYLEQLQKNRRSITPVYWLFLIEVGFFIRSQWPADLLSVSAFRPTDIPQYLFAYIWGRLAVSGQDAYILAMIPPISLPMLSFAISVLFSNMALLNVIGLAIPNPSMKMVLSPSVRGGLARMGGGFHFPSLMYSIWKELSFASVAPALLATFIEATDQVCWVNIPGIGKRQLKRYTDAAFLFSTPLSRLLQIFIDTLIAKFCPGAEHNLGTSSPVALASVFAIYGFLNVVLAWTMGCFILEYIPYMDQIL
jgi:hypothetical protein